MSDAEYEQDRISAAQDIRENGKQVELAVRERTGGTERSPTYGLVYYPVWVVELHQRLKNLDGSLAPGTVHQLLVSTEGLPGELENNMLFRLKPDDQEINIIEARPLRPGNVTILWEVDLAG